MEQKQPQSPQKCFQCQCIQTPTNPFRNTMIPGQFICALCTQVQAGKIMAYKNSRQHIYPEIQQILPNLFLGNQDAAIDQQTLSKNQISAICVCGSHLMTPFQNKKVQNKFTNILYHQHHIADFPSVQIIDLFDGNCDWIDQRMAEGRNVLVHCAAGVSRSASFVIAYLMNRKDMLFPDAIRFVKERRSVIRPNSGFSQQLEKYGKTIFDRKLGSQCKPQESQIKKDEAN